MRPAIIRALLKEVDPDIRTLMLKENTEIGTSIETNPYWAYLDDPAGTIIGWQRMRDYKKYGKQNNKDRGK